MKAKIFSFRCSQAEKTREAEKEINHFLSTVAVKNVVQSMGDTPDNTNGIVLTIFYEDKEPNRSKDGY